MSVEIKSISEDEIHHFVKFPYGFYAEDPNWSGELIKDTLHQISLAHPFWLHGERKLFMAFRDGSPVGRIAAIINRAHNSFHDDNCGFFGFFECENDVHIAKELFQNAEEWLKKKGFDNIIGPVNPSTNETCGMLLDGYSVPPMIMMPYNPPYYPQIMEAAGYTKAKDLYAYIIDPNKGMPERYTRLLDRILKHNPGYRIEKADVRNLNGELAKIKSIYNEAWEKNWGFVPMTDMELDELAKSLRQIIRPEFLYFAICDGEPAGFVLILPNLAPALKAVNGKINIFNLFKFLMAMRRTNSGRMLTLGVKKKFRNKGLELLLIRQAMDSAVQMKWAYGEMSWTLEDNAMINKTIADVGGQKYKTYRIYGKKL